MKPSGQLASCFFLALLAVVASIRTVTAQPAKPKGGPLGMKFVSLPKGTTYLGWNGKPGSAKKTEIKDDFEIAIHTVTQGQWQEVMGNNPSTFSRGRDQQGWLKHISDEDLKHFPVETVSWNDTQAFIKKLNEKEKGKSYQYRLPSEAEWEYACRGGATSEEECSHHFYFAKPTNDLSSKEARFGDKGLWRHGPTKVGSYAPNKLGLYDMHGNVRQWCEDLWEEGSSYRVFRGSYYNSDGFECRAASRLWLAPTDHDYRLGFRLARFPVR